MLANSVDPDQRGLIWVYTACLGLQNMDARLIWVNNTSNNNILRVKQAIRQLVFD